MEKGVCSFFLPRQTHFQIRALHYLFFLPFHASSSTDAGLSILWKFIVPTVALPASSLHNMAQHASFVWLLGFTLHFIYLQVTIY